MIVPDPTRVDWMDTRTGTSIFTADQFHIWANWNRNSSSVTQAYASVDGRTWVAWNRDFDSTAANYIREYIGDITNSSVWDDTTASVVWRIWNEVENKRIHVTADMERLNREERERLERAERERTVLLERYQQKQKDAEKRAMELLLSALSPQQRVEYQEKHHLTLIIGDKRYRIHKGRTGNIQLLDGQDKVIKCFCIHPREQCPLDDNVLAQKLLLETNEEEFLRVANHLPA